MKQNAKVLGSVAIVIAGLLVCIASSVNIHGNIINADTGYQVNGAAPSGHMLVGNGSYYVDTAPVTATWSSSQIATGCTISGGGSYSTCTFSVTFGTAAPDTNYSAVCLGDDPIVTGSEFQGYVGAIQASSKTTTGFTGVIVTTGTSYPVGFSYVDCQESEVH